jgi:hypothetical protein
MTVMIVGRREGLGQNPNVSCRRSRSYREDIIVAAITKARLELIRLLAETSADPSLLKPDAKLGQQRFLTTGPKCGERALAIDFIVRQQHNTLQR